MKKEIQTLARLVVYLQMICYSAGAILTGMILGTLIYENLP